jgi:serine-type D-Ala-D-Ala carboxypeptidase/endopeptidase (penicillin-binding protein 4)
VELDQLAGVGLLISGRHDLYVSSLAALLESRKAKVRLIAQDATLPRRLPHAISVVILESPLPAELRQMVGLGAPVIVLAERAGPEERFVAAQLGATALLAKNASLSELSLAIRKAVTTRVQQERQELTPRQREVLGLIVEGLDNREIAGRLGISERTARAHVSLLLERLGASNRTQAAVAAVQRGIVTWLLLISLIGSLALGTPSADARTGTFRSGLAAQLRGVGGVSGAWIFDIDERARLLGWSATIPRTPASLEKLFTTASALDRFGPQARLETTVLASGALSEQTLDGDLYVKGAGDPSLGATEVGALADQIAQRGIEQVDGRVYGDESYFDNRRGGPASGYTSSPWVGPLSALAFNRGLLAPFGHGFQPDPPRFVAKRLAAALRRRGVGVVRRSSAARAPHEAQLVASVSSPTVAALVRQANLYSDNYYAEMLIKGLGARFGEGGSTAAGAAVVQKFAVGRGLRPRVVDGSGLSRGNSVSARSVGRLLIEATDEPWFDAFYRSLPLAASSGTLHKRMRGTAAAGRCRAKTGTLIGVSGLAGYCRSASGDRIAFALLMNRVNVFAARRAQDRIAAALASYRG